VRHASRRQTLYSWIWGKVREGGEQQMEEKGYERAERAREEKKIGDVKGGKGKGWEGRA